MNKTITGSINCNKIDKEKLFPGKQGKYLNIVLIPTPTSDYGDYMIVQSVSKEERDRGIKGAILGNAKLAGGAPQLPRTVSAQDSKPETANDDVPF